MIIILHKKKNKLKKVNRSYTIWGLKIKKYHQEKEVNLTIIIKKFKVMIAVLIKNTKTASLLLVILYLP